jgi:integrase
MEELVAKIDKIENKKHKAIIALTSSVGLRVSEVINLKLSDINSKLMQIEIRGAKGKRPPCTNRRTREILRLYYIEYKPQVYLFNGQFGLQYSDNSCNAVKKIHRQTIPHAHLAPQCSNRTTKRN